LLDNAKRKKKNQIIGNLEADMAFEDALLGKVVSARQRANLSSQLGGEPAMAFALSGDAARANRVVEKWTS
jgi:hypothetical protein